MPIQWANWGCSLIRPEGGQGLDDLVHLQERLRLGGYQYRESSQVVWFLLYTLLSGKWAEHIWFDPISHDPEQYSTAVHRVITNGNIEYYSSSFLNMGLNANADKISVIQEVSENRASYKGNMAKICKGSGRFILKECWNWRWRL